MPTTRAVRLLPVILIAVACSTPTASEPVTFERLSPERSTFEFNTGINQQERLVIGDADAWAAFWARMYANRSPVPERPAVDFSKEVIVAVAMGARPSGGYAILVSGAKRQAGVLVIDVTSRSLGPGS